MILTIDAGTTAFKAVLFDEELNLLAVGTREFPVNRLANDRAELDAEAYWQACIESIKDAGKHGDISLKEVKVAVVCSHTDTLFPIGKEGQVVRNPIFWVDARAESQAERIGNELGIETIFRKTGQTGIANVHHASKIAWLIENEPDCASGVSCFFQVQDYLIYRLSGARALDRSIACSSALMDIKTGVYWTEMLNIVGVSESQLPEMVDPGTIVGNISFQAAAESGLKAGTRVVCGAMDAIAGAVGVGNTKAGIVSEVAGAALVLCATVDELVFDEHMRVPCFLHGVPDKYLLMPWCETGGMALKWFRDQFWQLEQRQEEEAGRDVYDLICKEAETTPPGAEGLIFLPFLAGSGSPDFDTSAKGVLYGLTLGHRRGHVARALLEGVAFMLKKNLDMLVEVGCKVDALCSLGGGSKSRLWCQIKADVTGCKLQTSGLSEETAAGAAILAAVGMGWYADAATAAKQLRSNSKVYTPRGEYASAYADCYNQYNRVVETLQHVSH